MATLFLSAVGTVVGGPLGGALGAIAGRQIDTLAFKPGTREGARLAELSVATSNYGAPVPAQFGRMRTAGSIIWATDLAEHRDKQGSGKGKPATTTYSYTASFAVAVSSRPIAGVGRIWADGKLLRGAAGDLKVAGTLRVHQGHGDQAADPLIAAAVGAGRCPAYRGMAYAVFEDIQLADFGNRIPALSFEVIADDAMPSLAEIVAAAAPGVAVTAAVDGLAGFALEGALGDALDAICAVRPLRCVVDGESVTIADETATAPLRLAEAAVASGDGFGGRSGAARERRAQPARPFGILRYYDVARDYQPGSQRAGGATPALQARTIELPAAMAATAARRMIDRAARQDRIARQTLAWRCAQLDPAAGPGVLASVPGHPGRWRIAEWELRDGGVELTLNRAGPVLPDAVAAAPGEVVPPADVIAGPTRIAAFELPWDGIGAGTSPALRAAVSAASGAWSGAALFADPGDGTLVPLGPSGRTRAVMGTVTTALAPASPHLVDRTSALEVTLVDPGMDLPPASLAQCLQGANRALVGEELLQFADAVPLGGGRWQLRGLLRGRGGTEAAIGGHQAGEAFILLDGTEVPLDPAIVGERPGVTIAAIGANDAEPAHSAIAMAGATRRPLSPVHGRCVRPAGGGLALSWTRRARGAWQWLDGVETPLNEQSESYLVRFVGADGTERNWQVAVPAMTLDSAAASALPGGGWFEIRQQGDLGLSLPLLIALP
ncbi:phage tail baseplate protein [Parablastomonas sp. CN1-191]|uniref:GTA baseplate fiber-binding domain-containing protein n=1 Tax=Parablastomonas sp. CN1-191 TaxID=3400908 RepID=UPI003BF8E174